jgi:hypothetical protein
MSRRDHVIQNSPFPILNGTKWSLWPEADNPDFGGFVDLTLINAAHWESESTNCVVSMCGPTGVCLDIGAHIGYYTVLLSRLMGPQGFVVGIEGDPTRAALCQQHITINNCDNARAFCRMLGEDVEGDRALIREAFKGRRINLIKTDVDGPDLKMWRMLEPIVAEHKPERVLFEVCDYTLQQVEGPAPYGQHCVTMCKLIANMGYELHDEGDWNRIVTPEEAPTFKRSLHNSSINLFGLRVR